MNHELTPPYKDSDIAIIGMAGRFPGAKTIEQFWQNLCNGVESITFFSDAEVEQSNPRLLDDPNYVKAGAVLDDIELFDAPFFGYSSREAALTDPQQRLLLECAWEAFERAGYNPETYPGAVGVYAGSSLSTYLLNHVGPSLGIPLQQPFIETDMAQFQAKIGNDRSYLATRISYKLNLKGPSINVQTACSTALVAVHLACQSLISGECDMALAGGVSVVVPHKGGYLYEEGMVRSSDGHCRAFDAQAEGTLFGNGGGLVLLKRLPDALADNDAIVAVIKGSAVNNDGALKVGYTAPSVEGQAAVIAEALALAEVDASTIGYVETHGTATKLGDPIEIAGLTQAFLQSSDAAYLAAGQCAIGSVKTNIGHLDEAAGIAGLIKAALAVQAGQIPPSLHFARPNPQIDFDQTPFYVNTGLRQWPASSGPRRAGVSSFGVGGTNSHLVLEEAPARETVISSSLPDRSHHLLTLSAPNQTALRELAQRYVDHLENQPTSNLGDICFTANTGRKHFDQRLAVVADSTEKLGTQLRKALESPKEAETIRSGQTIAFLFTGHGGQTIGMGQQLYATEPLFRDLINECDAIIRAGKYLDCSLLDILYPGSNQNTTTPNTDTQLIDIFAYAQPAIFAVEYALSQLWISWGIEPDIVMGHSTGEYVAACVAGVFSLADGLKLVCTRGRLMQAAQPNGEMVAVNASAATVTELLQTMDLPEVDRVTIATINGPQNVVVSGIPKALDRLCEVLAAAGIKHERLAIPVAAHSPLMASVLPEYIPITQQIDYATPRYTFISNVTGGVVTDEIATSEYWCRHLVQPVRFAAGMQAIDELGADILIEMGPTPTLLGMGRRCLPEHKGLWLPSLRAKRNDWQQILTSLADLYLYGVEIDWKSLETVHARRRQPLPTYPFQRKRCWIEAKPTHQRSLSTSRKTINSHAGHPLLGSRVPLVGTQETHFLSYISKDQPGWMKDHIVFQSVVVPGVSYLEMALAAAATLLNTNHLQLEEVMIQQALVLPEHGEDKIVQVTLQLEEPGSYTFQIYSLVDEIGSDGILHASGRLQKDEELQAEPIVLANVQADYSQREVSVDLIYQGERGREIDLGPSFWATEQLWKNNNSSLGKIRLPAQLMAEVEEYQLHPILLEACYLVLAVTYSEKDTENTYVPVGMQRLQFFGLTAHQMQLEMWCEARLQPVDSEDPQILVGDIRLFTADGDMILLMEHVLLQRTDRRTMIEKSHAVLQEWLYQVSWTPLDKHYLDELKRNGNDTTSGTWLIFADETNTEYALTQQLSTQGVTVTTIQSGRQFEKIADNHYIIDAQSLADYERVIRTLPDLQKVIYCWGLNQQDESDIPLNAQHLCTSVLYLTQTLLHCYPTPPALWLITHEAQAVAEQNNTQKDRLSGFAHASLWGLGRVIMLEHPELSCTCLDIDPSITSQELLALLSAAPGTVPTTTHTQENQLAWRNGQVYAARLGKYKSQPQQECTMPRDGSYLITGGLGGIGLQIARWLVEQGAGHLVLLGRSQPGLAVRRLLDQLETAGTKITVAQADICDADALAKIISTVPHPLCGIIHAAGVLDDGILQQQTTERFTRVLAPKVQGAWNLHQLTQDQPLDFFVLFSSVSSLFGTAGQASYAAANAFLDGLAAYRQGLGLPALSINWGSWSEVGLTARLGLVEQLTQKGEGVISPQEGVEIFGQLLREPAAQIGVMPIDWPRFLRHEETVSPFYQNFVAFAEKSSKKMLAQHKSEALNFRQQLADAPNHERPALLEKHIRAQIAEILGMEVSGLPREENIGFVTLGMDSLTAIELRNRLQRSLACTLPITFAFDYGTVKKVIGYLTALILAPMAAEPAKEANPTVQPAMVELSYQPLNQKPSAPTMPENEAESLEAIFAELARQIGK